MSLPSRGKIKINCSQQKMDYVGIKKGKHFASRLFLLFIESVSANYHFVGRYIRVFLSCDRQRHFLCFLFGRSFHINKTPEVPCSPLEFVAYTIMFFHLYHPFRFVSDYIISLPCRYCQAIFSPKLINDSPSNFNLSTKFLVNSVCKKFFRKNFLR